MKANDQLVRIPDVEVFIGAASSEVAVFAFYIPTDPADGYEMVSTISGWDEIGALRSILQACITTLNAEGWLALDELDTRPVENEEPPFIDTMGGTSST